MGEGRALQAIAEMVEGEQLDAVGATIWARRGWVFVASDGGLRLVRRPRLGRARDERFDWDDLTAVRSAGPRVMLTFGDRTLTLAITPHDEIVRLLDTARRHLAGSSAGMTADGVRTLARRDLGRRMTFGFEATIDGVPDHLEPGERVERVATASLDWKGLLVVTDRRVLLLSVAMRFERERVWSVARRDIRGTVLVEHGLRLDLGDRGVTLTGIIPAELVLELLADLQPPDQVKQGGTVPITE